MHHLPLGPDPLTYPASRLPAIMLGLFDAPEACSTPEVAMQGRRQSRGRSTRAVSCRHRNLTCQPSPGPPRTAAVDPEHQRCRNRARTAGLPLSKQFADRDEVRLRRFPNFRMCSGARPAVLYFAASDRLARCREYSRHRRGLGFGAVRWRDDAMRLPRTSSACGGAKNVGISLCALRDS